MKVKVVSQDSPKLLDRMRAEIRVRHYSIRTEEAYLDWARRFILFHNKQHPKDLGALEVQAFTGGADADGGAQFRVLASQLQALDRLVAAIAEVRSCASRRLGQAATADLVSLLRGGDGDCAHGHSCAVRWAAGSAARGQWCLLIM